MPMTLDELLLNIKSVDFNSLVPQTAIQTEEDKLNYNKKGYRIELTQEEFCSRFNLDPACVWYTPSISCDSLYFNKETLAAAPFQIALFTSGFFSNLDVFYKAIKGREEEALNHDFSGSISSFPDAMRMEYFNLLVERFGTKVPDLYNLFFTYYLDSDYGFGKVAPSTLEAIFAAKTPEEKDKTHSTLQRLPDLVTVYRGGNTASVSATEAYSWTLDMNIANFFACRRGQGKGYIVQGQVSKEDIIDAFLDDRNEQEVVINPKNVQITRTIPIHGLDFIAPLLPELGPIYRDHLDKLQDLDFAQKSEVHGTLHEARVLLHCLIISHLLNLPSRDRKILATAAIFHDTQRTNDDEDPTHGKASKDYYLSTVETPDPLVSFLCEYHCLPDSEGYREILNNRKLSKNRSRAKLLYDIFKDADALDRVRFGLKDLDINQLRLPVSRELSLVARLCYENVKLPEPRRDLSEQIHSAASRRTRSATLTPAKDFLQKGVSHD